jgi:hypothetical protein
MRFSSDNAPSWPLASWRLKPRRISHQSPIQIAAGLPLCGPWLGEQFARIHDCIRQSMGLKGGGARLDGASLPPTMIFAEDMRIVGQQELKYNRVQSRVTVAAVAVSNR